MARFKVLKVREWAIEVGKDVAKELLMKKIGYSESVAQKMIAGTYEGNPFPLQRKGISKLIGVPEAELVESENEDPPPTPKRAA